MIAEVFSRVNVKGYLGLFRVNFNDLDCTIAMRLMRCFSVVVFVVFSWFS